eukprot:14112910-Alexandrium_andersonii.AAC.1
MLFYNCCCPPIGPTGKSICNNLHALRRPRVFCGTFADGPLPPRPTNSVDGLSPTRCPRRRLLWQMHGRQSCHKDLRITIATPGQRMRNTPHCKACEVPSQWRLAP